MTHCPKHLCRLREGCSDCGENSRFYRTTADFCRCSKPNENADSALSDTHIGLLRLLSNKYVGTDFDLEQYGFSNQLKCASFREIIETVAILGSSLLSYANLDGRCYHQLSAEKIVNHVAVSADALANWPNGFISHIGKLFFPTEDYSALSCVGYSLEKLYQFSLDHQDCIPVVFAGFEAYLHSVAGEAPVVPPKTITPRSGRHKWLVCAADARMASGQPGALREVDQRGASQNSHVPSRGHGKSTSYSRKYGCLPGLKVEIDKYRCCSQHVVDLLAYSEDIGRCGLLETVPFSRFGWQPLLAL